MEKPIHTYYKKIMERPVPVTRLIADNIYLQYHTAKFFDNIWSNVLNPTGSFNFFSYQ